jgi:hypothetical protein
MNTSRATVGISAIILAAAISLTGWRESGDKAPNSAGDPSVPSATVAFQQQGDRKLPEGNVQDLAY